MTYFVKCFAEVHHQDICLMALVTVASKVVDELYQLGFTRELVSETMLKTVEDVVGFGMLHDMAGYHMLKQLAAYTCEAYRSVVGCECFLTLLIDGSDIGITPVLWDYAGLV